MTLEAFIASQSVPRHWGGWTSYTGGVDFPAFAPETAMCDLRADGTAGEVPATVSLLCCSGSIWPGAS